MKNVKQRVLLRKQHFSWSKLKRDLPLYIMLLLPMIYIIIFKYAPMAGASIAFKKYNIFKGIRESPWIGFDHFVEAFQAGEFIMT